MESLKKAKERAESYLYRIIDQKWNRFVRSDNRKLPKHYYEEIDWPLRFEAYSYLGNKYKNKINSFAVELRELWNEWVELNKKGLLGSKEIFWPTVHEVIGSIDPDRNEVRFSDNELWNHISMFRAREILRIGGYEAYFNEAKKRIRDALTSKPHLSLSGSVIESLESFVRSPLLKSKISDYLRAIARKLSEDEELVFNFLNSWGQAKIAFLLCFGNFGSDLLDSAKRVTMELIDEQAKNGSFENNLRETCLCASTIHYMKLDSSNSICNKAIDYILKRQNKKGYWDSFLGRSSRRYSTGRNVLSTVVVLETLDLITNEKPLPIWVEKAKPSDIYQKQKPSRVQTIVHFKTPEGINWRDISIYFMSEEAVQIRAGNASEGRGKMYQAAEGKVHPERKKIKTAVHLETFEQQFRSYSI